MSVGIVLYSLLWLLKHSSCVSVSVLQRITSRLLCLVLPYRNDHRCPIKGTLPPGSPPQPKAQLFGGRGIIAISPNRHLSLIVLAQSSLVEMPFKVSTIFLIYPQEHLSSHWCCAVQLTKNFLVQSDGLMRRREWLSVLVRIVCSVSHISNLFQYSARC